MPKPIRSIPHTPFVPPGPPEQEARRFYEAMRQRRSVRQFAPTPVDEGVIRWCVSAAGTAPSGANKQPWRFVAVREPHLKRQIRLGAEEEERAFYQKRASKEWLEDLAPLGTDEDKAFLEAAPWLVVVFKMVKTDPDSSGRQGQVYYANESVGIATGLFLAAAHLAGLATLTHTPSPMGFLAPLLGRPDHERPFLLIPVGYPAEGCLVPDIARKPLEQILVVPGTGEPSTPRRP